MLLGQLRDSILGDRYVRSDITNSWAQPLLEDHIDTALHRRIAAVTSNLADHLEAVTPTHPRNCLTLMHVFDVLDISGAWSRQCPAIETAP